eukprot:263946_1
MSMHRTEINPHAIQRHLYCNLNIYMYQHRTIRIAFICSRDPLCSTVLVSSQSKQLQSIAGVPRGTYSCVYNRQQELNTYPVAQYHSSIDLINKPTAIYLVSWRILLHIVSILAPVTAHPSIPLIASTWIPPLMIVFTIPFITYRKFWRIWRIWYVYIMAKMV